MKSNYNFDLIFVIGYFRSALPILSVVKHIKNRKIGFIYAKNCAKTDYKVKNYTEKFRNLLKKEGTIVCNENCNYKTKILVIQEHVFDEEFLNLATNNIEYKYCIGLLGYRLGFKGNSNFLNYFKIDLCTINDINLFNLLVKSRKCENIFSKYKVIEIGLPFLKYPPFQTPKVDWLIASPTTFSFNDHNDLNRYLKNVLNLVNQINKKDLIAYKSHNGNEKDYLKKFSLIIKYIPSNKKIYNFLENISKIIPLKFKKYYSLFLSALLQKLILSRAIPLSKLSDFHFLAVEAFIPNIKYGIIGGNSNTIWGTRFFKKKYLNCIDSKNKSLSSNLRADKLLNLNLSYFGIPYCKNDINYNFKNKIRDQEVIKLNIVDLLINKLNDYD